jgi:hypothetical protein
MVTTTKTKTKKLPTGKFLNAAIVITMIRR